MAGRVHLDLFCEDRGHELFVTALLRRLAREAGPRLNIRTRNARGGHGRAVAEFKAWQRAMVRQELTSSPDVMVLVIDGNCQEWGEAHASLLKEVDPTMFPRYAIGCPDPHVERWCIADPESFKEVVGVDPLPDPGKCDRGFYKHHLRESITRADQPILTDAMEFAPDLVAAMDLFRAGKNQRSLKLFIEDLKKAIRTLT